MIIDDYVKVILRVVAYAIKFYDYHAAAYTLIMLNHWQIEDDKLSEIHKSL